MFRLPLYAHVCFMLVFSGLSGCAREADTAAKAERDNSSAVDRNPPPIAAPVKEPLDLSLSEDFFTEEPLSEVAPSPKRFDAGELFDKKKGKSVTINVTPYIEPGEDPEDLPKLDGGSVSIETKTK